MIAIDDHTDHRVLRTAFGCFPSGVTVVAALSAERPAGMTVSSFTSVSLDPPLVSICIRRSSATWARLRPAAAIGVSVLGAGQADVCRALAAPGDDRFTGLAVETTPRGAVFLRGATAWLECTVHDTVPAGDHELVLLRVLGVDVEPDRSPLVFHSSGLHSLHSLHRTTDPTAGEPRDTRDTREPRKHGAA